jgi:hypothetical protein
VSSEVRYTLSSAKVEEERSSTEGVGLKSSGCRRASYGLLISSLAASSLSASGLAAPGSMTCS